MENDIAKLPKWAQLKFHVLQDKLVRALDRVAALTGEQKTDVEIDPHSVHQGRGARYLPDGMTVRFHLPQGYVDARIDSGEGKLLLTAQGRSDGRFAIFPHVSNSASVGFSPEDE
jgi:hypothetical protein